ncbi:hypothetical protein MTO96_035671, partial [Rhipicephalus appendiculatus]
ASKVTLLSLSQGVTTALVLLSTRPEYNDKVDLVMAYGPIANIGSIGFPLPLFVNVLELLALLLDPLNKGFFINVQPILTVGSQILGGLLVTALSALTLSSPVQFNQETPPAYPLDRVKTKFALFTSEEDLMADPHDVDYLVARLGGNVVVHYIVPQPTMQHLDFAAGYKATEILHNVAIDIVRRCADSRS